jgi:hypothetical protein
LLILLDTEIREMANELGLNLSPNSVPAAPVEPSHQARKGTN